MMTNYEVMTRLLKDKGRKCVQDEQLATVTYEAIKYLESLPSKSQQPMAIKRCVNALRAYKLSKNEILMIVNNPPVTPLEMQLIVLDEDRLSDVQVTEILEIVRNTLASPPSVISAPIQVKRK